MKTTHHLRIFLVILAGLAMAGCANPPLSEVDQNFGNAVRAAIAQQTINPDASRNRDPVTGIDGKAGVGAVDSYHQTYEAKTSQGTPINVNIGTPSSTPGSR